MVATHNEQGFPEKARGGPGRWPGRASRSPIKSIDEDTYTPTVTANSVDYDLTLTCWQPDFPSANGNIEPLYASSEVGNGGYNLSRYSNPEVDTHDPRRPGHDRPGRGR